MATIRHNVASLAQAVKPGLEALVATELQSVIDEAVEEVKAQLSYRLGTVIETRLHDMLTQENMTLEVNVEVHSSDK
jgi:hypothetical protein